MNVNSGQRALMAQRLSESRHLCLTDAIGVVDEVLEMAEAFQPRRRQLFCRECGAELIGLHDVCGRCARRLQHEEEVA